MTTLINLDNVSLAFGLDPLLDHAKLQINKGERVCLIGRNGAGKSSLLKIIAGDMLPDSGSVWRQPNLRIASLAQELPHDSQLTVYDYVSQGLAETGKLLSAYHALTESIQEPTPEQLKQLERLQLEIETLNGWHFDRDIQSILTRLDLNADTTLASLSGGWQRRAALAKALVSSPELILLDEPTNHLDIEAIAWLEDALVNAKCGLLFITHDRALLKRLATRIIELDRGNLTSWPGDYENFLRRKEERLHAESKENADFDKKLAQEEVWIRQGIKARRTRNEGRVRALKQLRVERAKRREVEKKATFNLNDATQSGRLVIDAQDVSYDINGKTIIKDFSARIMRGDKIGLIGSNGSGKTTLLSLLLGELTPTKGSVQLGTQLKIAYFDQLRKALDPNKSVIDNAAEGRESIEINGKKQHVISYLSDFLFTPQRALTPVAALSGGECNRLLLARLFTQPANLIVMDEPTNDLDIETLELLEDKLTQYEGTLLLVSHDRTFIDNVVTSTFVFEGEGKIQEYVGGYEDYIRQKPVQVPVQPVKAAAEKIINESRPENKKLSYKEQQELTSLPKKIEELETELANLQDKIADTAFYKETPEAIAKTMNRLKTLEDEISHAYKRWNELDSRG